MFCRNYLQIRLTCSCKVYLCTPCSSVVKSRHYLVNVCGFKHQYGVIPLILAIPNNSLGCGHHFPFATSFWLLPCHSICRSLPEWLVATKTEKFVIEDFFKNKADTNTPQLLLTLIKPMSFKRNPDLLLQSLLSLRLFI